MQAGSSSSRANPTLNLRQAVSACRASFATVAVFSLAINLLLIAPPLYMLQVYDRVITTARVETLILLTVMISGVILVLGMIEITRSTISIRIGSWLSEQLGPTYLAASVRARLQGDSAGAQLLRDISQLQGFISSQSLSTFFDAPWVPIYVFIIWLLHPWLGMLAALSALILLALGLANEYLTRASALLANRRQILANNQADAAIRNAEVVSAMGMMPALVTRWQTNNDAVLAASQSSAQIGGILIGVIKSIRLLVQVGVLALGAWLVIKGELTAGAMIAGSILLGRALAPVEQAVTAWKSFGSARIAYERLKAYQGWVPKRAARTRLPDPVGYCTLESATYVATGGKEPILRDVSLTLLPGEAVAVIGPSASGKSTLCRLLVGIAAPTSGHVRLDGSELQHWDPDQLGRHIGYLPQDVELFPGTVRENIARMGEVDDEAVVQAAQLAHAHPMIQQLPNGYETQIGDGGARLSGGQRQRIGLARAVYGDPRIIVLDEPNANLDQVGESALAAAIKALKAMGAAVLIVGHRPSTIAEADKLLVMRDGRIDVFGPRDAVLSKLRLASGKASPSQSSAQKPRAGALTEDGGTSTPEPRLPRADPLERIGAVVQA